jgi:hypothetical protein
LFNIFEEICKLCCLSQERFIVVAAHHKSQSNEIVKIAEKLKELSVARAIERLNLNREVVIVLSVIGVSDPEIAICE